VSDPEPPTGAGNGGSDDRSSRDRRAGRPTSRGRSDTPSRGGFRARDAGDRRTGGFGKPQRGGTARNGGFRDRRESGNQPRGSRDRDPGTARGGFPDRDGNAPRTGGFRHGSRDRQDDTGRDRRDPSGNRDRTSAPGGFRDRKSTGGFRARRDAGEQGGFRSRREPDRREPRDPGFRDRRGGSDRTGGTPPDRFRGRPDTSGSRSGFRDRRDAANQNRNSGDRPAFRPRRDPDDRPRDEKPGTRGDFRDRREPGDRNRPRDEARNGTGFRRSGERGGGTFPGGRQTGGNDRGERAGRPGRDQNRGGFRNPAERGGRFQDRRDAAGQDRGDRAGSRGGERDRGEFPGGRDAGGRSRDERDRGGFSGRREGTGRDRGERAGVRGDEQREFAPRDTGPELPEGAEYSALDAEARRELRGLSKGLAEIVGRHLVAAGMLVDEEPERALEHARYARSRAARVAIVREAAGLTAYHAGEWAEALGELRAVRRMSGGNTHLAVMADCERALGRPERALDLAAEAGPDVAPATAAELRIVAAGARRDLGQLDAAVVALQGPDLDPRRRDPWSARLFYAYADNLQAAGRTEDAIRWFLNAAEADDDELTDAPERAVELGATLDTEPPGALEPDAAADE
jgi:hypothetical protein